MWSIWLRGKTPAAQYRLKEAVLLISQDRLEEATKRLCSLIGDYPDFAEAYNQRAIAEFFAGQYDRARHDLRRALLLNPMHFAAIAVLGHCDAAEGQCEAAMDYYRQALRIHPHAEGLTQAIEELQDLLAQTDESKRFAPHGSCYPLHVNGRFRRWTEGL
jgi:tetratricopeptide (TPR) repeat protein